VTGGLRGAGYQAWDSVQALCSYVRGMLTSQALLTGVGVGRAARPRAAAPSLGTRSCADVLVQTLSGGACSPAQYCRIHVHVVCMGKDVLRVAPVLFHIGPHQPRATLMVRVFTNHVRTARRTSVKLCLGMVLMGCGGPRVQAATPLSAAFQFFLRDFAGMLGGILFALAQARALSPSAKKVIMSVCITEVCIVRLGSAALAGSRSKAGPHGELLQTVTRVAGEPHN